MIQLVQRSKHTPPRLYKPVNQCSTEFELFVLKTIQNMQMHSGQNAELFMVKRGGTF